MKKILALLLVLCCAFSIVACGGDDDNNNDTGNNDTGNNGGTTDVIESFTTMLYESVPTKSEVTSVETMRSVELISTYTLTAGKTSDGLAATTLISVVETLAEDTSGTLNPKKTVTTREYYLEGKGYKRNNSAWDADVSNFAPVRGAIGLNLDKSIMSEYTYDEATGTLVVKATAENATALLGNLIPEGQTVDSDVVVTVVAAGGRISSIDIEYVIEEHEVGDMDVSVEIKDIDVRISAKYYYNTQEIDI